MLPGIVFPPGERKGGMLSKIFLNEERTSSMEYGLSPALVAVVIITAVTTLGPT
jgi:Flp pilus assembly pilin Flp